MGQSRLCQFFPLHIILVLLAVVANTALSSREHLIPAPAAQGPISMSSTTITAPISDGKHHQATAPTAHDDEKPHDSTHKKNQADFGVYPHNHPRFNKSVTGGAVILAALAAAFILSVICYIRATRRKEEPYEDIYLDQQSSIGTETPRTRF